MTFSTLCPVSIGFLLLAGLFFALVFTEDYGLTKFFPPKIPRISTRVRRDLFQKQIKPRNLKKFQEQDIRLAIARHKASVSRTLLRAALLALILGVLIGVWAFIQLLV